AGAGASVEVRIRRPGAVRIRTQAKIVALQFLSAHEAGLRGPWRHSLAHDAPTQRRDPLDEKKTGGPRALQREEIRKQAAIEEIDCQHAGRRVGAAHAIVAIDSIRNVLPLAMSGDNKIADGGGVAPTQVKAFRAAPRS